MNRAFVEHDFEREQNLEKDKSKKARYKESFHGGKGHFQLWKNLGGGEIFEIKKRKVNP